MTMPNFIIIGAFKAGTSSLYHYLRAHPDVFMPSLKEPRFFAFNPDNPDHLKMGTGTFPITTLKQYEKLFDGVTTEHAIGEASPVYMNNYDAAVRIKNCIPSAKIIVSLRNPVDQTYSRYLMSFRGGREKRSFVEAFNAKKEIIRDSGLIYPKIKHYLTLFGPEKMKVIIFDDLVSDALVVMRELYQFLDVDDSFVPDVSRKHNAGGMPKNKVLHALLANRKLINIVKPLMPEKLRQKMTSIKHKNLTSSQKISKEVWADVLDLFREDIVKAEDLLQRDLSHWLRLD